MYLQFFIFLYNISLVENVEDCASCLFLEARIYAIHYVFAGHYDKSMLPHCWYTWLVVSLIPVMFIAGMVVQFLKTGKDHDHRQGEERQTLVL